MVSFAGFHSDFPFEVNTLYTGYWALWAKERKVFGCQRGNQNAGIQEFLVISAPQDCSVHSTACGGFFFSLEDNYLWIW